MSFKYRLLKAIDVAGLQILDPVIRLCYAEEPKVQLKRIGLYIVIPALTFMAFIGMWWVLAPKITTKSGEVPTPPVVWEAAKGILRFHNQEDAKTADFNLSGSKREAALAEVNARMLELEPLAKEASIALSMAELTAREKLSADVAPLSEAYRAKRREFATAAKERQAALLEQAATITAGDAVAAAAFQKSYAEHEAQTARETEIIKQLRDEQKEIENAKAPELIAARVASNRIEEEIQFLRKRQALLTGENAPLRADELQTKLATDKAALVTATTAPERLALAKSISAQTDSLAQLEAATYSRPWTLPDQIGRSLRCMFTGFILASTIAIPLGLLCGLSPVVMSALTPLISLFKPVSPIVWLPIIFIIVGGFIPDPNNSSILDFFNAIPIIGGVGINPAFLASAVTVALCSLWPTLVNTALGVAAVDKDHMNVAKVLRLGVVARLFRIIIPSALPLIFAGLRISLGVGWMVLIAAELLASSEGIGKFVWDMFNNGSSQTFAQMFVVVFVVGFIGLVLDRIMIVFQRLVSFDGAPTSL